MRVSGNNIMIHTGESFTIDKYFVNKDGSPYVISNKLKNPYILISVCSNSYNTRNNYKYNQWCDVSNFYRFASTQAYQLDDDNPLPSNLTILDPSIGRITNNTGATTYYCDDTIFVHQGEYYLFVYSSNPKETSSYAGSYVKYELRFIANFDSEITKNWSSQQYNYSITLVSGKTMHEGLTDLYAANIGETNVIGGTVFKDALPYQNVEVKIYAGSGTNGELLATLLTDIYGKYSYEFKYRGYYTLTVDSIVYTTYLTYTPTKAQTVVKDFTIDTANVFHVYALSDYNNIVAFAKEFYSNKINWGDGTITTASDYDYNTISSVSHTYSTSGSYTVSIYGDLKIASSLASFSENCNYMGPYDSSNYRYYDDTLTSAIVLQSKVGYGEPGYPEENCFGFYRCCNLTNVELPNCKTLYGNAFTSCSNLVSADMPVCETIGIGAFASCYELLNVNAPNCKNISVAAFSECDALSSVNFPVCVSLDTGAFANCSSLLYANLPLVSELEYNTFSGCLSLTSVNLQNVTSVGTFAFRDCYSLTTISLPKCSLLENDVFSACSSLQSVYLLYSSIVTIQSDTFYNCGITSSTGHIYVPSSLVSIYKTSGGWWANFSEIIQGV